MEKKEKILENQCQDKENLILSTSKNNQEQNFSLSKNIINGKRKRTEKRIKNPL